MEQYRIIRLSRLISEQGTKLGYLRGCKTPNNMQNTVERAHAEGVLAGLVMAMNVATSGNGLLYEYPVKEVAKEIEAMINRGNAK